jgi:hypothetical protein
MAKKKSKVVGIQEDGTEIFGFEEEPKKEGFIDHLLHPKKKSGNKNDIQNHSKFDKFKGEKK